MKNVIVSVSAALLLAGAGSVFAATPRAYQQSPPQYSNQMNGNQSKANCPEQLPSFGQVDSQNRGYITEQELSKALNKEHVSTGNLQQDFSKADSNHNGKLSHSEYSQWQSQCGPTRA